MPKTMTSAQMEKIQIDYGIVFVDYGEVSQRKLAPTRGGAEFTVTKNIRDIEFDGGLGKTKGMQVVDGINAVLKFSLLDMSQENLELAQPFSDDNSGALETVGGGLIPDGKYLLNLTMFARTVDGKYKKITLYNALNEADLVINSAPKAEGAIPYEVYAHWDPQTDDPLYSIEDVSSISDDQVKPTATTTPTDGASNIVVGVTLTAVFSEAIMQNDIKGDNFLLIKVSDGSIVAGTLSYNSGSKTASFEPDGDLAAGEDYIWTISRVRDVNGNAMLPLVVNFSIAA